MSEFYMDVSDLLEYYGIDIAVYTVPKEKIIDGVRVKPDIKNIVPDKLHEPVLPASSSSQWLAQFVAGGTNITGDMLWLSSADKEYPVDQTIVEVLNTGKFFKVLSSSNYAGYSNLKIYQLKGDSRNPLAE